MTKINNAKYSVAYEAPVCEAFTAEVEGMLCQSTGEPFDDRSNWSGNGIWD